ncbi:hypothetical protein Tco_0283915, partial [Tanacetum coccineum]
MFDGPGSYNGRKNGYQETLQSRNTMMDVELIELCWSNILCPGVPVSRVTTEKLVVATPMNKNRQVTVENSCATSANDTQKQVEAGRNQNTNRPLLPSTGVNSSTNASGSQ